MDEKVEYQLRWVEAAIENLKIQAITLVHIVENGKELLEDFMQTAAALHMHLEAVKGKLTPKPPPVEEKVEEPPTREEVKKFIEEEKVKPKRSRRFGRAE